MSKILRFLVVGVVGLCVFSSGYAGVFEKDLKKIRAEGRDGRSNSALIEDIGKALALGADVNAVDDEGNTVLHRAVKENDHQFVRCLLYSADKTYKKYLGTFSVNKKEFLVDKELKNKQGYAPLHLAAWFNAIDSAEQLLVWGADVNVKQRGVLNTPLHIAVEKLNGEMVEILLGHEADVTIKNLVDQTPLSLAENIFDKRIGDKDGKDGGFKKIDNVLKKLIALGKHVSQEYKNYLLARFITKYGMIDMVDYLLDHGADINARSIKPKVGGKWTILYWALREGEFKRAKEILEDDKLNVDPNAASEIVDGDEEAYGAKTPLEFARKRKKHDKENELEWENVLKLLEDRRKKREGGFMKWLKGVFGGNNKSREKK